MIKITFIDEWKSSWRYLSVWYGGVALTVLFLWNSMPISVHRSLPSWVDYPAGLLIYLGAWYTRIIAQPKTKAKIAAKKFDDPPREKLDAIP